MTNENDTAAALAETATLADTANPTADETQQPEGDPAAAAVETNEDKVRADRAERAAMRLRREKATARAEADFYREQASRQQQQAAPVDNGAAMTRAELEAELQRREWLRTETEKQKRVVQKIEKAKADDPDFADALEASGSDFRHDQLAVLYDALDTSDNGIDVLRYLAKNQDEADRLAGMSPMQIAREFGRLETKVAALAKPKISNAPKPIDSVRSSTSPSAPKETDTEAWIAWRNKQVAAKQSR